MGRKVTNKILNSKLWWAIFSVVAALFLWLYVVRVENPQMDSTLTAVPVVISGEDVLLEDRELMVTDVSAHTASIKINGKRADITGLNNSNVQLTVDVSGIKTSGTYTLPYVIDYPSNISENSITLDSVSIQNVTVTIVPQVTKTVNVKGAFVGSIADGYQRSNMEFSPDTIRISGPQDVIDEVAYAYVELSGQNVDSTITEMVKFKLMDKDDKEVSSEYITSSVSEITATMPVVVLKEVYLTVDIINGGGATSANVNIDSDPKTVMLAGDAEILSGINQIVLGTVDLSQVDGTFTKTYDIVIPNNIENVTGVTEATVTVSVTGLATNKYTATNFQCINVPLGYTAVTVTQSIEVMLRGPEEDIEKVAANNIRIVADLSNIGQTTGMCSVEAKVYIDGFSDVGAVGTYNIVVNVS